MGIYCLNGIHIKQRVVFPHVILNIIRFVKSPFKVKSMTNLDKNKSSDKVYGMEKKVSGRKNVAAAKI